MADRTARTASVAEERAPDLLVAEALSKRFDLSSPLLQRLMQGGERRLLTAVDRVSLTIPRGSVVSVVGESGCGKSTMARLIVGLHRPTSGRILFDGREVASAGRESGSAVRRRMQMIFQDPYASLNPRWRVRDIVAEPIRTHRLTGSAAETRARVGELLEQVGLSAADGRKYPHEFSGGQRQRISIARALASEPEFLVCDEPTSALDVSVQAQILNLMKDLQRRFSLTYLFISHNLAVVYHISDYLGVMYLGRLVEWGPTRAIFQAPRHPYTRMLLDSVPRLSFDGTVRVGVQGEVPSPLAPPKGCHFHPRCPFADARCRSEEPGETATAGGWVRCHAVEEGRLGSL